MTEGTIVQLEERIAEMESELEVQGDRIIEYTTKACAALAERDATEWAKRGRHYSAAQNADMAMASGAASGALEAFARLLRKGLPPPALGAEGLAKEQSARIAQKLRDPAHRKGDAGPAAWAWYETEYPEEGCVGPYDDEGEALAAADAHAREHGVETSVVTLRPGQVRHHP